MPRHMWLLVCAAKMYRCRFVNVESSGDSCGGRLIVIPKNSLAFRPKPISMSAEEQSFITQFTVENW
eukprot:2100247-Amphidinium_carterae.1